MSGDITFNGMRASSKTRQLAAFVEQEDDYHLPALSVRETLRYAAILKLPAEMSRKRKYARAEEVLRMLGLTDCANGVVGGELLKGISGGEKRRLSLACQMINDPSVLVLDEPTSGLDSATAFQVMQVLENIARTGRCVIISVHQPRSDIFHLVDRVLLLGKGGNVVYEGERSGMLSHFAGLGYKCPSFFNPADYALDLVSVDLKSNRRYERSSRRVNELVTAWRDHDEKRVAQKLGTAPLPVSSKIVHTPIHIALPVILERSVRNMWRQQDLFWMRWIQAPVLAICFYIFFLRIPDGDTGGQTRIGLIAQSSSAVSFVGFLNLVALYPPEKAIFFHEYQSAGGAYGSATFITSL